MSGEYKRWEARYSVPDYIFGNEPNYFLAKCMPVCTENLIRID